MSSRPETGIWKAYTCEVQSVCTGNQVPLFPPTWDAQQTENIEMLS